MIIAIEGLDAAGKRTQTEILSKQARKQGMKVEEMSFPRYGETSFSLAIDTYLQGGYGDLFSISPYLSSLLFAGDRFESLNVLTERMNNSDLLILDRYVASNIAYQAARIPYEERSKFITWISHIEYDVHHMPKADITIYLDVSSSVSKKMSSRRKHEDSIEKLDIHEENIEYLSHCQDIYHQLAASNFMSKWYRINCVNAVNNLRAKSDIAEDIFGVLAKNNIFSYVEEYK